MRSREERRLGLSAEGEGLFRIHTLWLMLETTGKARASPLHLPLPLLLAGAPSLPQCLAACALKGHEGGTPGTPSPVPGPARKTQPCLRAAEPSEASKQGRMVSGLSFPVRAEQRGCAVALVFLSFPSAHLSLCQLGSLGGFCPPPGETVPWFLGRSHPWNHVGDFVPI